MSSADLSAHFSYQSLCWILFIIFLISQIRAWSAFSIVLSLCLLFLLFRRHRGCCQRSTSWHLTLYMCKYLKSLKPQTDQLLALLILWTALRSDLNCFIVNFIVNILCGKSAFFMALSPTAQKNLIGKIQFHCILNKNAFYEDSLLWQVLDFFLLLGVLLVVFTFLSMENQGFGWFHESMDPNFSLISYWNDSLV